MGVKMCHILGQHCREMTTVDDQHSVQQLSEVAGVSQPVQIAAGTITNITLLIPGV
jgi:hypothetical protein